MMPRVCLLLLLLLVSVDGNPPEEQQCSKHETCYADSSGKEEASEGEGENKRQYDVRGQPGEDTASMMRWLYGGCIAVSVL